MSTIFTIQKKWVIYIKISFFDNFESFLSPFVSLGGSDGLSSTFRRFLCQKAVYLLHWSVGGRGSVAHHLAPRVGAHVRVAAVVRGHVLQPGANH